MKILLGMSGGADSTYAASKLLSEGHVVEGAVLKMHCYTELDEAKRAADELGIPLHIIDCTNRFDEVVKANFVSEYLSARTPNPCIICNEKVKFEYLWRHARENGFDKIATGHYAGISERITDGVVRYSVRAGDDPRKDQSYMLYRLPQYILRDLVFPLEHCEKPEVRRELHKLGISSADKPDSQEICFLPDGGYAEYIESVAGACPKGDFVDKDGNILGTHNGIIRYTVGQRKGLGISLGERAFVTNIDPVSNKITLSPDFAGEKVVEISDPVYSGIAAPSERVSLDCEVRLRYSARLIPARAELLPDGTARVFLDEPARITPGQSAVAYVEGSVAFGGIIR